jgi:hypothetical protein
MAKPEEHQKQADHNQRFLESIDTGTFPDWVATVAFYKAVHLVEKMFRARGHNSGSHTRRNNVLKRQYLPIWREYKTLYSFSRLARYWCFQVKAEHVKFILQRLGRVEREIKNFL